MLLEGVTYTMTQSPNHQCEWIGPVKPQCGQEWNWRGNEYIICAVFGATLRIDAVGSGLDYYTTNIGGGWSEPSR